MIIGFVRARPATGSGHDRMFPELRRFEQQFLNHLFEHTGSLKGVPIEMVAGRHRKLFVQHLGEAPPAFRLAEERGVDQIGTLTHTIAIKQGPVILDSVSELKQKSIQPLLSFLPEHAPTFTDEGYPWLARYNKNHRAVNHSARARDKKRSKWARNRWSRNGVHNQVAEGTQRIVKQSFLAAYSYFKSENSQLYLDEFSALKAIRVYGLNDLLETPFVRNVDHR